MNLKIINKNILINFILILSIFLTDRFSKIYVIYLDKKFFSSEIFSSKFLNINLIWNEGIAFGLLSFSQSYLYNLVTFIISGIIILILFLIIKSKGFERILLSIILGGALGNFYDRIFFNAVPDFIDFHIGDLHWFIFNIADIFITLGVIMLILLEIVKTKNANEKV